MTAFDMFSLAILEAEALASRIPTPGRYVGAEAAEEDDEPFEEKMQWLTKTLEEQFAEPRLLQNEIAVLLKDFTK